MNVAVGVSRLGQQAEFIGRYGDDQYGQLIDQHLRNSHVKLPVGSDHKRTSTARASIQQDGAAQYQFDIDWSLDQAQEALSRAASESSAIHVGSIAAMLEPGAHAVLETVRAGHSRALISYDPNCRPSIVPDASEARNWVQAITPYVDVLKASDEDLLWLYPQRTVEQSALAFLQAGVSLLVVTRGEFGPWALNRVTAPAGVAVPAYRVEVADTVGAGDSLMAALLAALLDRGIEGEGAAQKLAELTAKELEDILNFAATAAGITVSRQGANPPTRQELLDELEKRRKKGE